MPHSVDAARQLSRVSESERWKRWHTRLSRACQLAQTFPVAQAKLRETERETRCVEERGWRRGGGVWERGAFTAFLNEKSFCLQRSTRALPLPTQTPLHVLCGVCCARVCVCSIASSFLASRASLLLYRLPPHHLITILVAAVDSVIARAFASKLAVLGSCVQLPPKANAQAVLQLPFTEGATGGQSAARWRQMLLGGIFKVAKGSTKLALVLAACSRLCCRCCHSCQCCCPCGSLPQRLAGCSVTSRVWRARLAHLKVNARLN